MKCKIRYCEGAKMSLSVRLLARLLGLGQAFLKICSDQTWPISLRLCIVFCLSKVYSTVIEFNVWLWNRIRTADYFPALMLQSLSLQHLQRIHSDKGIRSETSVINFSAQYVVKTINLSNCFFWNTNAASQL